MSEQPSSPSSGVFVFFIVAIAFHIADTLTGFNRMDLKIPFLLLYFVLAMFAMMVFGFGEKFRDVPIYLGISFACWILPVMRGLFLKVLPSFKYLVILDAFIVFFPLWPMFVMIVKQQSFRLPYVNVDIGILYFWVWFILLTLQLVFYLSQAPATLKIGDAVPIEIGNIWRMLLLLWENIIKLFKFAWFQLGVLKDGLFTSINQFSDVINNQVNTAIYGQQETGPKQRPLGITFEDVHPIQSTFFDDEPISIVGKLRANLLNGRLKIIARSSCMTNNTKGDFSLKERFEITNDDVQQFECSFPQLSAGDYQIVLSIDYTFQAFARLPQYFVSKESWNSISKVADRTGQRPEDLFLSQNKLKSVGISTSSSGPVKITAGFGDMSIIPVGSDTKELVLIIRLEKVWPGEILEVERILLVAPNGLLVTPQTNKFGDLEEFSCDDLASGEDSVLACNPENDMVFKLPIDSSKPYSTFVARVRPAQSGLLVGQAPYSTKEIRVFAEYKYRIKDTKLITVRENTDSAVPRLTT